MSGRYLLDTNILIAFLRGEERVSRSLQAAEEIFVPAIVVGELYYGASNSSRPEANRALIDEFVRGRAVLSCDLAAAREYGRIKAALKARGTPLPENDIWIAAVATSQGLSLVSRDGTSKRFQI